MLYKTVLTLLMFTGQTKRRYFSNYTDILIKCLCSEFCLKMSSSLLVILTLNLGCILKHLEWDMPATETTFPA